MEIEPLSATVFRKSTPAGSGIPVFLRLGGGEQGGSK
jgi:hypothetical protein